MADARDPLEPRPIEIDVEPTVAGRFARWIERARLLHRRVEASRAERRSVDLEFSLAERTRPSAAGCSPARLRAACSSSSCRPRARHATS